MKLARLQIAPYSLPLRGRLGRTGAWLERRDGLIITVRDGDGACGYGEAAPAPWVGGPSVAAVRAALERVSAAVARGSLEADDMLVALLGSAVEGDGSEFTLVNRIEKGAAPAVRCALETALLDLSARREGRALATMLGEGVARAPASEPLRRVGVNALLTAESATDACAEAGAATARGFTTLKLKVGGRSPETDIERVRAVRHGVGGAARMRLDANRAWSLDEARRVLAAVSGDDIEYVEEPLCEPSPSVLAELAAETGCRLAVDESLDASLDAEKYIDSLVECAAVTAVIIKPMALHGPRRSAALAAHARAAGLGVTFTDSIETAIGRSAVVHLAAASGSRADVIGLGGAELLACDIDGQSPYRRPNVAVDGPGFGPVPLRDLEPSS